MIDISVIFSIIISIISFAILFKPFFGTGKVFLESFEYTFKPNALYWPDYDPTEGIGKFIKFIFFFYLVIGFGLWGYIFSELYFK